MHFKKQHGFIVLPAICLLLTAPVHTQAAYKATARTICSTKTSVHIRKGPGLQYPVQTTIQKGQHVNKIGVSDSWSAIKAGSSVYYIKSCYLKKVYKIIYVSGNGVNLRTGPGTNYHSVTVLPKNTKLKCIGKSNGWMKVKYKKQTCYISRSLTSTKKSSTVTSAGSTNTNAPAVSQSTAVLRAMAVNAARSRLGDIYSQAKRNLPGYADCSSLLRDVFLAASGVNIGETTNGQIAALASYKKPLSALQAGDILMRIAPGSNHAALYIGNNQYIHASSTRGQVVVSTYYPISSYWTCCYDAVAYCNSRR